MAISSFKRKSTIRRRSRCAHAISHCSLFGARRRLSRSREPNIRVGRHCESRARRRYRHAGGGTRHGNSLPTQVAIDDDSNRDRARQRMDDRRQPGIFARRGAKPHVRGGLGHTWSSHHRAHRARADHRARGSLPRSSPGYRVTQSACQRGAACRLAEPVWLVQPGCLDHSGLRSENHRSSLPDRWSHRSPPGALLSTGAHALHGQKPVDSSSRWIASTRHEAPCQDEDESSSFR